LQCDAVCCSVLPCVAVCCSAMQCVAVCCSVLQCVAMCCSMLQCVAVFFFCEPPWNEGPNCAWIHQNTNLFKTQTQKVVTTQKEPYTLRKRAPCITQKSPIHSHQNTNLLKTEIRKVVMRQTEPQKSRKRALHMTPKSPVHSHHRGPSYDAKEPYIRR